LAAMLRDQLGLAVALANNAYVMALGEQAFWGCSWYARLRGHIAG
jgi:predicted NBD/HSP70 family sugar kinase